MTSYWTPGVALIGSYRTIGDDLVDAFEPWITPDLEDYLRAIGQMFLEVELWSVDTDQEEGYSVLLHPDRVPANGIAWLGQFVGERVPAGLPEAHAREWIKDAPNQRRGTVRSIFFAAQRRLVGNRTVLIRERDPADDDQRTWQEVKDVTTDHAWQDVKTDDPITWRSVELGDEDPDRLTVITYSQESPSPAGTYSWSDRDPGGVVDELETVVPAAIVLNYEVADGRTWEDVYNTTVDYSWADLKAAKNTWLDVSVVQPGAQVFTRPMPSLPGT